ncbi:MAG: two-component system response regulator GlrR [Gammaproteobacteria bacterium]|jgi:two-component system response regulator GlrR
MTNATTCILLVDDDASLLRLLSIRLESQGYRVETAQDGPGALVAITRFSPALVITDLRMDGMDGAALLDEIQIRWPGLAVLLMTAHGTIPDAVEATQRGAFGFLTKPLDKHELRSHIERAIAVSSGSRSNDAWRRDIVGNSVKLNRLLAQAKQIAITAASVLITGPSGSGKEVLARAIHQASGLDGPFVAINTGALPLELLESELFGHERGSFTGASTQRTGLITAADGGSLFLDEIGDMPAALQVKLLRVLQEGEVRPVGSNRNIAVKVRVISATHRYLPQQIERGEFREDLFYRLGVVELAIPPLAASR